MRGTGPYGPLGHGSFMPLIEHWTRYILTVLHKTQTEAIKSLSPSLAAARDFRRHADLFLQRTAWTSPCASWFKAGRTDGQAAVYPGSRVHFFELLRRPRYEDFEIGYWDETGNRFAFLGNGWAVREGDGSDGTSYLGLLDEERGDVRPEYDEGLKDVLAGWALDS